jgi:hypothetical protein
VPEGVDATTYEDYYAEKAGPEVTALPGSDGGLPVPGGVRG